MLVKSRLIFAVSACLLLSNCGLIGTALRLAPYAMMFADENGNGKTPEMRGREVQRKAGSDLFPAGSAGPALAFKR